MKLWLYGGHPACKQSRFCIWMPIWIAAGQPAKLMVGSISIISSVLQLKKG